MQKIIVIGCPGSGKSTLSRALHNKTGIPLYYLDRMFWNADKTTVEKSVFLERLSSVLKEDKWIIDGNYASTMEMRIAECDTVIFLDYSLDVCLAGIRERLGKYRDDMPWIESEEDKDFIQFVKDFEKKQRPLILALLDKYNNKNTVILKSRAEADKLLNGEKI